MGISHALLELWVYQVRGWVCAGRWVCPWVSMGHRTWDITGYVRQVGGTYPTGMQSCFTEFSENIYGKLYY